MNVRAGLFLSRPAPRALLLASACGAAVLGLAGCVSLTPDTSIDPRSPIAAEVARTARTNDDYPRFSEIPAAPTDLRPIRMYGQQARDLEVARNQVVTATAPETWTLSDTEAFASRARAAAGPELTPPTTAESEAFAEALRKRATPPPPPKR